MSFSTDVKSELCAIRTDGAASEAQCHGMLMLCRSFSFEKILFQTGCKEAAELFSSLLRYAFDVITAVKVGGSARPTYTVEVVSAADRKKIMIKLGYRQGESPFINFAKLRTDGNVKAFIRGALIAGGSVSDPEKQYRLEFSFAQNDTAADFIGVLDSKGFDFTMTYRAKKFLVYTKNSTTIEELLAYLGAGGETLNLIGVKVYKSVRNKLNRQNNFETSNIMKTANAAYQQTRAIEKLKKAGKLESLPEELYEAAQLRLSHPEMSLSALCKLSKAGLTRSGLNHRISKLIKLAEDIK
jgi:DNA-binding protein WhiA